MVPIGRFDFSDGPIVRRLYVACVAPRQGFVKLGGFEQARATLLRWVAELDPRQGATA